LGKFGITFRVRGLRADRSDKRLRRQVIVEQCLGIAGFGS
jgi:hypothetical protein